jgi:glycosyltransferase involved in cell wall biosynthesis
VRIAHVVAGSPRATTTNGVARHVHFLAKAQASIGLDVALFALTADDPPDVPAVDVRAFRLRRLGAPAALQAALDAWRPDLLHLHSPYFPPNATLAAWARRRRLPYVVTPHGALSPGELANRWFLKLPYKVLFERPLLNHAAFVHAVGASEALDRYGVTAQVVLAPCGIDFPTVPAELDRQALASRHPALRGRRVFFFLGRLDPRQKGLDLLVRAFAAAGLDGATLVVAGPDFRGGRAELERMAARTRAPILVLGPLHGRMAFDGIAGADVFVHPSRWEGMPQSVLEAAAVGVPSLVTPPADPLGRLSRGGGAVVVELGVASIAAGLRTMAGLSDDDLRAMGERARAIAREFTWEGSARILADAYARACGVSGHLNT